MKRTAAYLLLTLTALVTTRCFAQQLLVGDIPVSIGIAEKETINWFRAKGYVLDHRLSDSADFDEHTFAVRDKRQEWLGVIGFKDAKLDYASRHFSADLGAAPSADLLAKLVFEQLRQLKDEDALSHCAVDAREEPTEGTLHVQGGMSKTISFNCGIKRLSILISPAGRATIQVNLGR